jgi:hypothetical protein
MRRSSKQPQLPLFHPTRSPAWGELPPEVRQQTIRLLSRLLRARRPKTHADNQREEAVDE